MKKETNKNTRKGVAKGGSALLLAVLIFFTVSVGLSGCSTVEEFLPSVLGDTYSVSSIPDEDGDVPSAPLESRAAGNAEVYFFDVGQGDASLIIEGGKALLIDAGDNGSEEFLIDAISSLGVERLDYVVATHNHADHIGGMEEIINAFEVGVFFTTATPATTVTYERMLEALEAKPDIEVVIPQPGEGYVLGESGFMFLAPFNSHFEFNNQNDSSLVLKYTNGVHKFIFMADAEAATERDLLDSASDVSATVLRVGHHGSSSSSTPEFIEAVGAEYAVISVGEGNQYGHPHRETLDVLASITVLMTSDAGTIVMESNSDGLAVHTEKMSQSRVGDGSQ